MTKAKRTSSQATSEHSEAPSQTADVSGQKAFDPTRSKEEGKVYDEASDQNREHDFVHAILEARKPQEAPAHVPPVMPPAIAEQTRREMEAGAKRVMEFASQEIERQEVHERNRRDKWADKENVPVFRPDDYVPDQKKGQGHVMATSTPMKE